MVCSTVTLLGLHKAIWSYIPEYRTLHFIALFLCMSLVNEMKQSHEIQFVLYFTLIKHIC
jgi:hypothetical protein